MKTNDLIKLKEKATSYINNILLDVEDKDENVIKNHYTNKGVITGIKLMFFWIQSITENKE